MKVEGHISDADVVDILRVLCLRQNPTRLTVMRGGTTGQVVVGQGQILQAWVGDLTGEAAVVELLRWREGVFKVSDAPSLPERNVRSPLTELILRASRPGPESPPGPRRVSVPPPAWEEAAPAAPSLDQELDGALTALLARLEREVARFEGLRAGSRGAGAVPILESVLERILETGRAYVIPGFTEQELRQLAERQAGITPTLKLASVGREKVGLGVFREMLASPSLGETQRRELFGELVAGTLGLVNGLFTRFARHLRSEDLREQWQETFEAFLTDITTALDAVKL